VIANSGALFRTARALPVNIAKELLLTGAEIPAKRAHKLGFVNRLADPGEALATAIELAELIAANSPVSVQQTLQAIDAVVTLDDEEGWAATVAGQAVVTESEDMAEGITAFFEKRPPQWNGR
jgi:enoyl-CoA hydratase/carnithine racemase